MPTVVHVNEIDAPEVLDYVGLRDRELRVRGRRSESGQSVFVAEGDVVVNRALRAGFRMRSVLVDASRLDRSELDLPEDALVVAAGPELVTAITGMGVHRGSVAIFERRLPPAMSEIMEVSRRLLVLEGVMNPINLGVIVRSAVALGMDAMLLDEQCADPLYRRSSRVAMGEVFDFPYAWCGSVVDALTTLVAAGFITVALTPDVDASDISTLRFGDEDRVALVLGSEGPGMSRDARARCSVEARIPLVGRVDSLNVGAAAAVAMYVIGTVE